MGWIEIDNLSKLYVRKGKWALISQVDSDDDDDDDDDFDRSTADADKEPDERERPPAQEGGDAGREVWALRDINLRINEGEAVAVVGFTGSGKTTLMRILAGLSLPTYGEVRGKGLRVPLSFLRSPILGSATGRQNLEVLESLFGMPRGRILDRANEIAAFAGMQREIDQKVSQYSSSMYGKLALAAGLFCDPGILLVEDRIAGGDAPFRAKVLAKLDELVGQGTTLIYAGQSPKGLPSGFFRRAVWLVDGRVVADGQANVVLPRYEAMCATDPSELADMQASLEASDLDASESLPVSGGTEVRALPRRNVRLVRQQDWHDKVDAFEARWERVLERRRAAPNSDRYLAPGLFRAELSSLAKVTGICVVDSEGHLVSDIPPGEALQVEVEVEVVEAKTEIGMRVELDTRKTLLFASDLSVPFRADEPGRYLLTFPLEAWLTQQEVEDVVLYKIRARTFFRKPGGGWEDMNVATARLFVRGSLRQRFLLTGTADQAASEPIPVWLDAVTPRSSPDARTRQAMLRPKLGWQIYRLEDAVDDETQAGDVSHAGGSQKGCAL